MSRKSVAVAAIAWMVIGCALFLPAAFAQGDAIATDLVVDRQDAGLDKIIPTDASLEEVVNGYTWLSGPVWDGGSLFFADIPSNSIVRWTPGRGVATFLEPSGYKGKEQFSGPNPGSNGMTLDAHARLTVAGLAARTVFRFEPLDPTGIITVLADTFEGKKLNSPSDIVYRSDGSAYFTDPADGLPAETSKELDVEGVYRIPHALSQKAGATPASGELQLLIKDLARPSGIVFSPDEKYLYVDSAGPKKLWMRYGVNKDGTLSDPKVLFDASNDPRPGIPGGMKVDVEGNIYSAAPGGVIILSPDGKVLGTLIIPEKVAGVTWAGPNNHTLYITASSKVYRVKLNIAGAPLIRELKESKEFKW